MVQATPEPTTSASPQNNKPTVMVLGSIGHGKSTFLNRLAGDENFFHAARSVKGVTQYPTRHELPDFDLIDTPGLNDCRIPTADWVQRFNSCADSQPQPLSLALLVFKASIRPNCGDQNILAIWRAAIDNINA